MRPELYIIGYGSQASAWAQNFQDSGWSVHIFLRDAKSASAERARAEGFSPKPLSEISALKHASQTSLVAFLCADKAIGSVYRDYLEPLTTQKIALILAHGYAVYSGDLNPKNPLHQVALFAPKGIGPEVRENFLTKKETIFAATKIPVGEDALFESFGQAIGIPRSRWIATTPEKETIADLISERWVLCGTLFSCIEWTQAAMRGLDIPEALIHQETVRELELIARMLNAKGLEGTRQAISQMAKEGAESTRKTLEECGIPEKILETAKQLREHRSQ